MKTIKFLSPPNLLHGIIDLPAKARIGILFLHGGGQSTSSRYLSLQQKFSRVQIASLAFDFRGCGHSQGSFEEGSLIHRLADSQKALEEFVRRSKLPLKKIFLWGSSMGGHVASRLVDQNPEIRGLILQSAAAYGNDSEALPLNSQFTQSIQKPNSWLHSPAFTCLENYFGQVLVIYGQNDQVIPESVKDRYRQLAEAKGGHSFNLHQGTHQLLNPSNNSEAKILDQLTNLALNFLLDSTSH